MTLEEFLEQVWGMVETFGPWLLAFFGIVAGLALSFILWVFFGIVKTRREIDRRRAGRFHR